MPLGAGYHRYATECSPRGSGTVDPYGNLDRLLLLLLPPPTVSVGVSPECERMHYDRFVEGARRFHVGGGVRGDLSKRSQQIDTGAPRLSSKDMEKYTKSQP